MARRDSLLQGQATISFILLLGGIIMEVAIAGALVMYFAGNAGAQEQFLARARTAAYAGIRDAQLKIMRNKELPVSSYTFFVGKDVASTTIARTVLAGTYRYDVHAQGIALRRVYPMYATFFVDETTGIVSLQSLQE